MQTRCRETQLANSIPPNTNLYSCYNAQPQESTPRRSFRNKREPGSSGGNQPKDSIPKSTRCACGSSSDGNHPASALSCVANIWDHS